MSILRGDRVLLERRRINMNQDVLASKIGVDQTYISKIERGQDINVGIKTVQALAEALGVSVAYLIDATESPLGEPDAKVLSELHGDSITVDVDSEEERKLVRALMAEFNALPRRAQTAAIEMIRLLRRIEDQEHEDVG